MIDPIHADQLTAGDIILYQGDELMVYTEPVYTTHGMVFNALPLAIEGLETQVMSLPLEQPVQLIGYQQPYDYNQPLSAA